MGFWKRWLTRHVNALSFWAVLAVVASAIVLSAWLLGPRGHSGSPQPSLPVPSRP